MKYTPKHAKPESLEDNEGNRDNEGNGDAGAGAASGVGRHAAPPLRSPGNPAFGNHPR